jgi:hypothetical protein
MGSLVHPRAHAVPQAVGIVPSVSRALYELLCGQVWFLGHDAVARRASWMSATVPALSMAGAVFGMHTTEVNPPRAAAAVPVAIVSLDVWPGSRR